MNVKFYKNEITSFLGHNGAGKTTTIQMLTGLLRVTSGNAYVCGHSIVREMQHIRKIISVCPQENILWDHMTCCEHVSLWFGIRGLRSR